MAFDALLATLLNDPNLGIDIVYKPLNGPPISCRATFAQPDVEQQLQSAKVRDRKRVLLVKASDIAAPCDQDAVEIPAGSGCQFRVLQASANDPMRLTWRIDCGPSQ